MKIVKQVKNKARLLKKLAKKKAVAVKNVSAKISSLRATAQNSLQRDKAAALERENSLVVCLHTIPRPRIAFRSTKPRPASSELPGQIPSMRAAALNGLEKGHAAARLPEAQKGVVQNPEIFDPPSFSSPSSQISLHFSQILSNPNPKSSPTSPSTLKSAHSFAKSLH